MDQTRFRYQPGDPHADDNWYSTDGNMLSVSLYGNCSTGYEWEYSISDDSVLTCHTSVYVPFRNKNCKIKCDMEIGERTIKVCGAGGVSKMIFTPEDEGYCMVMFSYKRPWERKPIAKKILAISYHNANLNATEIGNETYDPTDPLRNLNR